MSPPSFDPASDLPQAAGVPPNSLSRGGPDRSPLSQGQNSEEQLTVLQLTAGPASLLGVGRSPPIPSLLLALHLSF